MNFKPGTAKFCFHISFFWTILFQNLLNHEQKKLSKKPYSIGILFKKWLKLAISNPEQQFFPVVP